MDKTQLKTAPLGKETSVKTIIWIWDLQGLPCNKETKKQKI